MSNDNGEDLSARVSDIEKTIGDIAAVLQGLKEAVTRGPGVDCPPYCAHGVPDDYEDELSLADRVSDIRKCIGDFGTTFDGMREVLEAIQGVDCPPYCAHDEESQS